VPGQPAQGQALCARGRQGENCDLVGQFGPVAVAWDGPGELAPPGALADDHGFALGCARVVADVAGSQGACVFRLPPARSAVEGCWCCAKPEGGGVRRVSVTGCFLPVGRSGGGARRAAAVAVGVGSLASRAGAGAAQWPAEAGRAEVFAGGGCRYAAAGALDEGPIGEGLGHAAGGGRCG
jgi:hypothetical protein